MTKEQIFESGFIKAFIAEYFEAKTHSFYPDKDRLLYILCNSEQEKKEVTIKQIGITKAKISELGFDELSFAYLLSCKPESLQNYIEPNKRFDFWLNRFSEEFEDLITDFDPITKAIYIFNEVSELSVEVMENESEFWEWYPQSQCPKIADFIVNIIKEADLLSLIENDIDEYNKNEYWELYFEEYEKFIDVSKPIEILFNLCELLVHLNRLEMFNEFLEIENEDLPHQQTDKPKPEPNENELSEKIKKHFGFFNENCPRKHKQILKDADFDKLIGWTVFYFENKFEVPEILDPIKTVNTNKTYVQLAFKYLFKYLHKSSPYPKTLFEFYKSAFYPYSDDKKSNFDAVQNNDEVKKLMKLDY